MPARPMKTLKKRSEFLAVAKGARTARRAFVLQGACTAESDASPRVGYTVTKKTGNSVERNRIKRRLRAAIAQLDPKAAKPGCNYVLVGRRAALSIAFEDLQKDLASGFDRVFSEPASKRGPRRSAKSSRRDAPPAATVSR